MAISEAGLTAGQTYSAGNTVTATNLNLLGQPTVKLGPSGDADTGLSNPSANVLGVEAGGSEVARFSSTGVQVTGDVSGDSNSLGLVMWGGLYGNGANIELYGGSHATAANDANFDADDVKFRSQNAGTTYGSFSSAGLKVGSTGNGIKAIWYTTQAITQDIAQHERYTGSKTVTGAAVGDAVLVTPQDAATGLTFTGYCTANTVYFEIANVTGDASQFDGTISVMVFDIT